MPQLAQERGKIVSPTMFVMFGVVILVFAFLVAASWLLWFGETD
jgi:hypothetical protein